MIRRIWNYLRRNIKLRDIISGLNIGMAICVMFLFVHVGIMLSHFDAEMGIFYSYFERDIGDIAKTLLTMVTLSTDIDINQLEAISALSEAVKTINNKVERSKSFQNSLAEKFKKYKRIDIKNVDDIKKANMTIVNITEGTICSGSHVKIKNKNYILTCAHILKSKKDLICAFTDEEDVLPLELINSDKIKDLALFRIHKSMKNYPALEISNEYPKIGSEILIIGNPGRLEDVITNGVISKIQKQKYIFTNKIYYGNSGGAIIYKGKIIGVVLQLYIHYDMPVYVNYGIGSNLKQLKRFLEDTFEEI